MKKQYLKLLAVSSVFIPYFVFAEEAFDALSPENPWWFPLLEVGGVIVTIFALYSVQRVLKSLGGHIGDQFKYIQLALALILFAFAARAFIEFNGLEGFIYDVVFELPFYGAALLMAFAAKKLAMVLGK
jgi:hypothetical protein